MTEKTEKTYHVHVNPNPHEKGMGADSGCKYNVQKIKTGKNWRYGVVDFGTCSRIKLWFYLRWLNLHGFRKDKEKW